MNWDPSKKERDRPQIIKGAVPAVIDCSWKWSGTAESPSRWRIVALQQTVKMPQEAHSFFVLEKTIRALS